MKVLYAIIACMLWGTCALLISGLVKVMTPLELFFGVSFFAALSTFIYLVATGKLREIKRMSFSEVMFCIFLGFLGVFLPNGLNYMSYAILPAHYVIVIHNIWPILFVMMQSSQSGRLNFKALFSPVSIGFTGIMVAFLSDGLVMLNWLSMRGLIAAFCSACAFALYSMYNARSKVDPMIKIWLAYMVAMVLSGLLVVPNLHVVQITSVHLMHIVWLAVVANVMPFVFYLAALKNGPSKIVANLMYFAPLCSVLILVMFGRMVLQPNHLLGMLMVIACVGFQAFLDSRDAKREKLNLSSAKVLS